MAQMLAERRTLPLAALARAPQVRTILFVDDEPNLRAAMRRITRHKDYRACLAANAAEAFEILATVDVGVRRDAGAGPGGAADDARGDIVAGWDRNRRLGVISL